MRKPRSRDAICNAAKPQLAVILPVADEDWRDIPGLPEYQASSLGRIRSLDGVRVVPNRWGTMTARKHVGRVLSPWRGANGYMTVQLPRGDGAGYCHHCVSRLVFAAFHRAPEDWEEVDHGDLDRVNNRPDNLTAMTVAQNRARRIPKRGSSSHYAKLGESDVLVIRERLSRETQAAIAADYGVSRATIGAIKTGSTWAHV